MRSVLFAGNRVQTLFYLHSTQSEKCSISHECGFESKSFDTKQSNRALITVFCQFSSFDQIESPDTTVSSSKSKEQRSSSLLIDLFDSQTKQIVNAVLKLTRQNNIDEDMPLPSFHHLSLSSISEREQMQMVKHVAIAVRDLLQTLDYAPVSIKEMVRDPCRCRSFFTRLPSSPNNATVTFPV